MNFADAIRTCFQKYATFDGRAARSEYWWFALLVLLVQIAAGLLSKNADGFSLIGALAMLVLILPSLAVGARRLHDVDRSGWWLLIGAVPIVGPIILLVWTAQPGSPGVNRFGVNPLPLAGILQS